MELINDLPKTVGISTEAILAEVGSLKERANGTHTEPNEEEILLIDSLRKALVDPTLETTEGTLIVSIDSLPIATLGNFSCIIGKAKSKKTFLITLIIGAFLKGSLAMIQAYKASRKTRIIWFDTEQSRNHISKAYKRALSISNGEGFYEIEVYALRSNSPGERLTRIDYVLRNQNPKKDIAFCVIDGVRDLMMDINDPAQATEIVTWLMKVTEDQDLHICTVLHQNKGNNDARGHIGTEIINKAESVLSVCKKEESISLVRAEFCRDKEFQPFAFSIDEATGLPQILVGYYDYNSPNATWKLGSAQIIPSPKHKEIMGKVFGIESEYSYTDLVVQSKLHYDEAGFPMGDNRIKGVIRYCLNQMIIKKDGSPGTKAKYIFYNDSNV